MLIKATMDDAIKARIANTSSLYLVNAMEMPLAEVFVTAVDMTTGKVTIRPSELSDLPPDEVQVELSSLRVSY